MEGRPASHPFSVTGGLRILTGNLGRAIIKTSSLPESIPSAIQAPARVFVDQDSFLEAYRHGQLQQDVVAVLPGQGPAANGMPELHKLSPALTSLQNQGFNVKQDDASDEYDPAFKEMQKTFSLLDTIVVDQYSDNANAKTVHQYRNRDRREKQNNLVPDRTLVENGKKETKAH